MPIHDWSRVRAGMFHHFHNSWIYKLSDRLNAGVLPAGFYAAGEQIIGDAEPDVLTFQSESKPEQPWEESGAIALAENPPRVSLTCEAAEPLYVHKQDHVVVRSTEGDRLVALIEIVSRGNKDSRSRMQSFVDKVCAAVEHGCHVLLVDLFPPRRLDPAGMHGAIWEQLTGEQTAVNGVRTLMLASYRATPQPVAYIEQCAVGNVLPEMPLFLDAGWYVRAPLEETYVQAWAGFPGPWKEFVDGQQ
jgi:hypothetical protein